MNYITIIISILSVWTLYDVGNKKRRGWIVGLVSQFFWFYFIIKTENYGLLAMNIIYTALYIRNLIRWKKNEIK